MSDPAETPMTADDFISWALARPEGEHYELMGGEIVAMAPERVAHARAKSRIWRLLAEAVEGGGLACEVFPDGMAVRVDADTIYEPDVMVRCGEPLADDAIVVTDPLILVEVRSPSTGPIDSGIKLDGYFHIPSVRHYLIVDIRKRAIIHHQRDAAGAIATRIIRDGHVRLDPPGIELSGIFGQ